MKRLHWILVGFLTTFTIAAIAGKMTDNTWRIGEPGTADSIFWIFDTNDGAANVEMQVDSGEIRFNNGSIESPDIDGGTLNDADIDLGTAADSRRLTLSSANDATLAGLTRKAGTMFYSTDQSNVVFDDGSDLRPVGTGSGGGSGINLASNPDAETNADNWTASGGTFSRTIVAGEIGYGDASFKWDSSAAAQTIIMDPIAVPNGLEGKSCIAKISYSADSISSGDIVMRAELDDGTDLTANLDLEPTTGWRDAFVAFTCPSDDSVQLVIESVAADAAAMLFDQAHIGSNINEILAGDQTEIVAAANYAPSAGCTWGGNSATLGPFGVDTDCPSITQFAGSGAVNTTDNNLPDIVFDDLPAGTYEVTATGHIMVDTADRRCRLAIYDGSVYRGHAFNLFDENNSLDQTNFTMNGVFVHAGGAKTFSIHVSRDIGGTCQMNNADDERILAFTVKKFSGNSTSKVTLETQGYFVSADIGGDNLNLGGSLVSAYTAPDAAGLTLIQNSGSAAIGIPCSSTNENTVGATTCSVGSEQIGGVMNIPHAGAYQFCTEFTYFTQGTSAEVEAYFQLVETGNADQTIISVGGSRVGSGAKGNDDDLKSFNLCGVFNFSSAGKKTIRLARKQNANTLTNHFVLVNRGATNGDRNAHFYGFSLTQQFPQAIALSNLTVQEDATADCTGDVATNVCSGTYTPSLQGVANCSTQSVSLFRYTRIGKVVNVWGQWTCDVISAQPTLTTVQFSIPIPSDLNVNGQDVVGYGAVHKDPGSAGTIFRVTGNGTNETASMIGYSTFTSNEVWAVQFSYEIN